MLSIEWQPNKKDPMPLYKQIAGYIKEKIQEGAWPIYSKLPSQRELTRLFQVNRSTLITALEELIADGILESKVGSGVWVANNTWSLLTSATQVNWNNYVDAGAYLPNLTTIQEINRCEFKEGIIRLGTGELSPELIPSQGLQQVLAEIPSELLTFGYEEPKGLFFLRQQVSLYLESLGIHATPSSILIVSGALQALQLICSGLLPSDAGIFLEKPSYLFSLRLFQSMAIRLRGLPMDQEGLQPAPLRYQRTCKNASVLYTIPCFHNPTGRVMSAERRREILTLCQEQQLPIIEDDVYRDVWLDTEPPLPLKALDKSGLVIYIGSLSKALSPGLRIGWVVGPEPVVERLADIKMQNDYGSSSLSQWVAAEYLASGLYHQHLEELRPQLKLRRKAASEALKLYFSDIAAWEIPQGGFYIWLTLTQPVSMPKLFKMALSEGLLINPGSLYDPLSNRQIRLSYSYADPSLLKEGYHRLAGMIKECSQ